MLKWRKGCLKYMGDHLHGGLQFWCPETAFNLRRINVISGLHQIVVYFYIDSLLKQVLKHNLHNHVS